MSAPIDSILEVVGRDRVIRDEAAMAPFLEERRGLYHGRTIAVVTPASTAEVARVIRICHSAGIGVVPQGGNTGLCGGAVPAQGEIVMSLNRLNRIREVDADNFTLTAEAGCILADLQQAAARHDRYFPLSLGAEGSCQIGGNLSTNAGGVNVLRYGNARELTLGLEVVLPNGEVWDGLTALRKNNTGYDLKDVFVGAEGTLGIITAAVLKLFPAPVDSATGLVALRDLDAAIELLGRARAASADAVSSFELMSRTCLDFAFTHIAECRDPLEVRHEWYVLLVFSGTRPDSGMGEALEIVLAQALEDGLIHDAVIAASEAQAQSLWRLREGIVEAQRFEGGSIKHDVAVKVSQVPQFIDEALRRVHEALPGIRPCVFGHIGDGNIHFNLSQPVGMRGEAFLARWSDFNDIVHGIVHDLGGSFSAEHGIGRLKVGEMQRFKSGTELALMRAIKRALDPKGIMNPGKVLPEE